MSGYNAVYQRTIRQKKRLILAAFKADRGSRNCGERDAIVLDLHHINPVTKHPKLKKRNGSWVSRLTFDEIAAEVEKCIVLCANCHRREEAVEYGA